MSYLTHLLYLTSDLLSSLPQSEELDQTDNPSAHDAPWYRTLGAANQSLPFFHW